jgi:hypothetical protein
MSFSKVLAQLSTVYTCIAAASCSSATISTPEPILGARIEGHTVYFTVATGGCTDKDSFNIEVRKLPNAVHVDYVALTLVRRQSDNCRGYFPDGKELIYELSEIGLTRSTWIELQNPLSSLPRE